MTLGYVPAGPGMAFGTVQSNTSRCYAGRTVTLSGGGTYTTTSDANGNWSISNTFGLTTWYASVAKTTYKKHGTKHICTEAVSPGYNNGI